MKILVVSRGLPFHQMGGMEVVAWDLAKAFARAGATVTALTTGIKGVERQFVRDGVAVHPVRSAPGCYSRAWWKESVAAYESDYAHDVDVVFSISAGGMRIARSAARHPQRPVMVAQTHGTSWGEIESKFRQDGLVPKLKSIKNFKGLLSDIGYRYFDSIIGVGPAVENDLRRFPTSAVIGRTPVGCIVNGVNADALRFDSVARRAIREELGIPDAAQAFISACRLHPQKGVLTVLRAFKESLASKPDSHLIILGDGPEQNDLFSQAALLRIGDRVHFRGRVAPESVPAYLSAADTFVFASKRVEGLPMNVLEALASGLPIIMSDHLANDELPAVLVSPHDEAGLAHAMVGSEVAGERISRLPDAYTIDFSARSYMHQFARLLNERKYAVSSPSDEYVTSFADFGVSS